jgi:hypothetical protein
MWSRPDPRRPEFFRSELGRPQPPGIWPSLRRKCWSCLRWSWHRRSRQCLIEPVRFIAATPERVGVVEAVGRIRARLELARLAEPACLVQLGIKPDRLARIAALCFELGLLNGSRREPLAIGGPHVGTCIRLGSTRPMPGRMGASPSHIGHQSPLCYLRRRMARSTSRVASLRASSCRLS